MLPEVLKMQCSNPRDKIFALRELFSSVFGGIEVDYNRTVEELFTEATRCLILASGCLEALYTSCACKKLYNASKAQKERCEMPSWAIDWAGASKGSLHHYPEVAGDFREEESWYHYPILSEAPEYATKLPASFSKDGLILRIFGKSFTQVSDCVSDRLAFHQYSTGGGRSFVSTLRRFLKEATQKQLISEARVGSVTAWLLGSQNTDDLHDLKKVEGQIAVENDVDKICDLMGTVPVASTYSLLLRRRRLFVTTDGRIGFGNRDLVPGDLLCNFSGLYMPFIVREKGAYHELITPAIVHGAMHLEMWPEDENEIVPWEIV